MCGAEKQSQRVRVHDGVVGLRKSQWTTDFSQNSGIYIVYNSHVTCSNSSSSLVMVTPTSYFVFHWLPFTSMCCFFFHWLLTQVHFYGRTYLSQVTEFYHVHRSRWYSDNPLVDIIFSRRKLSTTSAGHGDVPVITPILSMICCVEKELPKSFRIIILGYNSYLCIMKKAKELSALDMWTWNS